MKNTTKIRSRILSLLLALVLLLGLVPTAALANSAVPDTIKLTKSTFIGPNHSAAVSGNINDMVFDMAGSSVIGMCSEREKGMGWSLEGHTWNTPTAVNDPIIKTIMAYFYSHTLGVFTDQAVALKLDQIWGPDQTRIMIAWTQAVIWRATEGLLSDTVVGCAEELMNAYNTFGGTSYTSIDDQMDGTSFRDRAQYILDLGEQGVWGDCDVYEYHYAGPGSSYHPSNNVQSIYVGTLTITRERYQFTIKKVDATNPNLALPGARFLVRNANGTFEKEVVTGSIMPSVNKISPQISGGIGCWTSWMVRS